MRRPASAPASWSREWGLPDELGPRAARVRRPDRLSRGRPLLRRQGGRDAGREVLSLLPAPGDEHHARRDRVRGRLDSARRLREDHRHEPGGGDSPGGRPPRLLRAAGLEADRRHRRRSGRQPDHRLRHPLRSRVQLRPQARRQRQPDPLEPRSVRSNRLAGRGQAARGRQAAGGRRGQWHPRAAARADRGPRVRRHAERRLHRRDARDAADRARRQADDGLDQAEYNRRGSEVAPTTAAAARLHLRSRCRSNPRSAAPRATRWTRCGTSPAAPSR